MQILNYLDNIKWLKGSYIDFLRIWHPRYEDFTINSDSDFYSVKIILDDKIVAYEQSGNEFVVSDLTAGSYTVELIYNYRYNNQSYRVIHSKDIVIS